MNPNPPRRAAAPTPVAGGEHIRPEWVEAAAEAIANAMIEQVWSKLHPVSQETFRRRATLALAAVVPAIQAQALRDAAAWHDDAGESVIAGALTYRADLIERGELP